MVHFRLFAPFPNPPKRPVPEPKHCRTWHVGRWRWKEFVQPASAAYHASMRLERKSWPGLNDDRGDDGHRGWKVMKGDTKLVVERGEVQVEGVGPFPSNSAKRCMKF